MTHDTSGPRCAPPRTAGARACLAWLCATLLLGRPGAAVSADITAADPARPPTFTMVDPDTYIVTLSGTLLGVPRYPGAEDYTAVGYPGIDIRRPDEPRRFSAPDDNFSVSLYDDDHFRVGPTARLVAGRYFADDRHHLFGFRDTRFAIEPGAFVEIYPMTSIRLRGELRQGVYGHHGTVGTIGADYILPIGQWEFSIGPRVNLGDASFARKYFGVSATEAALNGRVAPYAPTSFAAAGLIGAATFTLDKVWAYTAFAGYTRIIGEAAKSPLVWRPFGSPDQVTFGLKISYSFEAHAPFKIFGRSVSEADDGWN